MIIVMIIIAVEFNDPIKAHCGSLVLIVLDQCVNYLVLHFPSIDLDVDRHVYCNLRLKSYANKFSSVNRTFCKHMLAAGVRGYSEAYNIVPDDVTSQNRSSII
jgi:hypothetical protein